MTRFSYLAAPVLMAGYGVVRLIDGLDGSHGPGPAWTTGHLLFLAALALFGVVLFGLRHEVVQRGGARVARVVATAAVVAGLVGLLAFVRSVFVDLIVGFHAVDRPDMDRIYPRYDGFPGGLPDGFTSMFDVLGPLLLIAALLTLTIQLTAHYRDGVGAGLGRRLSWWHPVVLCLGFAAITVDLDLLPVGGILLLLALAPMAREGVGVAGVAAAVPRAGRPGAPRVSPYSPHKEA